ncbi:hypothetical protein [Geodermatophilus dictyosporus]|uniref:hypothetical protein n=1 Tax=Geodermatophilus dictyosporus TaxID=1523247 RepID=UPI000A837E0A|nr:hypothetical protein [Geodermatophilus dictyosporus]
MRSATLYRVLAALLVLITVALLGTHLGTVGTVSLPRPATWVAGAVAGFGIGVVAAVMGSPAASC